MEPEKMDLEMLKTLMGIGNGRHSYDSSSYMATDAYKSLMEEISKYGLGINYNDNGLDLVVYINHEDLLRDLYPLEYSTYLGSGLHHSSNAAYVMLKELLEMSGQSNVRPLPSVKKVPAKGLLQFSHFTNIDHKARTLSMPLQTFEALERKQIAFDSYETDGLQNYTKILFVESTEQYRGQAIPFMYIGTNALPSNYNIDGCVHIFQSPMMFNNNTERWTIKITQDY